MKRDKLKRLESKIENRLNYRAEFPIFLFKENENFVLSEYVLKLLKIDYSNLDKSKLEANSYLLDVNSPLVRLDTDRVYFNNTPYSAFFIS